jgi:hypothetical protein
MFTLKNITEEDIALGQGNMGALVDRIYVADRNDILNLNIPSLDSADPLTITADIQMKPGKKFKKWYFTPGTGKFSEAVVGETDGKSQEPAVEFIIPKNQPKVKEQIAYAQNASLIVIAKDANGQVMVIGTTDLPAKFEEGGPDTGQAYADRNHTRFMFKAPARFGCYYYTGGLAGLVEGDSLENSRFTAVTATVATDTVALTFLDNSDYFDNAEGTDQLQVTIKNETTGDVFNRANVALRSAGTASIVVFNIGAGNVVKVDAWFKNAAGQVSPKTTLTAVVS